MNKLLILIILVLTLFGCDNGRAPKTYTVSGIQRVLMHTPEHYSFLIVNPDQQTTSRFDVKSSNIRIIMDVSKENADWIQYSCERFAPLRYCFEYFPNTTSLEVNPDSVIIHLHDVKEVNGAGWNYGKFGSGQTKVVE